MNHYELCYVTAKKCITKEKADVVLFEYQSTAIGEFPDVLMYRKGYTTLYEIKVSRTDFKKDGNKGCRKKYKLKYAWYFNKKTELTDINWKNPEIGEMIKEAPHLGGKRYYVCPEGLIQPEEILNGWGLFWVGKYHRFFLKKKSEIFRRNIHDEIKLLTHAFRKYGNANRKGILIKKLLDFIVPDGGKK